MGLETYSPFKEQLAPNIFKDFWKSQSHRLSQSSVKRL